MTQSYNLGQPQSLTASVEAAHALALETLFRNFRFDLEQVANTIDPILTAQNRCQQSSSYIQGIISGDLAFLCTNLVQQQVPFITAVGDQWQVGRSYHCAIPVSRPDLAPYHAAIEYRPGRGFLISTVDEANNLTLNDRILAHRRQYVLADGDWLGLGDLRIQFLIDICASTFSAYED